MLSAIANTAPVVSVRVNSLKGASVPQGAEQVPWCPQGFYLPERRPFTFDPDFHSGRYYVQDASSMFIAHVIRQVVGAPVRYLDLCAAPGGKTTAALSVLPAGSFVVANEIVAQRARVLADNVMRWGDSRCVVTNSSPRDLGRLAGFFDVVAADVPCSGEGMFRKDAEAVAQWSPALVAECAARQRSIVADVWPSLRPGGIFIYSTCTFNRAENEDIIEHIVAAYGAEPLEISVEEEWGVHGAAVGQNPCYRFLPHKVRGEGLFMCVLRKPEQAAMRPLSVKKIKPVRPSFPAEVRNWLTGDYALSEVNGVVRAVSQAHAQVVDFLCDNLRVLQAGIAVGTQKGRNLVPAQALALATDVARGAFAECDVDYGTAIAYLRGEAIGLQAPRGYVLVTYRGAPLGFVNNLGNRANNLYPKPLRILSSNAPATAPAVL